jgi:hypothetical protein
LKDIFTGLHQHLVKLENYTESNWKDVNHLKEDQEGTLPFVRDHLVLSNNRKRNESLDGDTLRAVGLSSYKRRKFKDVTLVLVD